MGQLTIVADIRAEPGQGDLVRRELLALVDITRAEDGCLLYDLHQDDKDPEHFLFYETWASRALWQAHMEAPHLKAFGAATEGALASLVVHEMTNLGKA